jgi:DNA-binding MarR family transcriptional regulator
MLSNPGTGAEASGDEEAVDAYRLLVADVYELAGTSRRTSESMAAAEGQTAARWHLMSVVSDGPRTVPSIARRLGQARQSVQRVVHDLAAAGLVDLRPNPDHRRSSLVALTPAGRHVLDRLWAGSARARAALLTRAGVSTADLHRARATLRALLDANSGGPDDG